MVDCIYCKTAASFSAIKRSGAYFLRKYFTPSGCERSGLQECCCLSRIETGKGAN